MRGHSILAAFVPPPYLGTPLVLRLLLVSGAAGLALLVLLGPADGTLAAAAWTRLELTFASSVSLVTALLSIPGTTGRVRRVRSWMSAAIGFWLMGEMIRNAELAFGHDAAASLSDVPFIGVLVCAGLGYAAALKGQLRPSEALAVYLDGAIVFFAREQGGGGRPSTPASPGRVGSIFDGDGRSGRPDLFLLERSV